MAWAKTNVNDGWSFTGTVSSVALGAFSAPLTNPSIIVVCMFHQHGSTASVPTDTAGNVYVDCGAGSVSDASDFGHVYYALNTSTTANNIVTVHTNVNATMLAVAAEFTGGETSNPIDVTKAVTSQTGGVAGSDILTTGSIATTLDGDLVVGFVILGGTPSHGVSPNTFTDFNADTTGAEYFIQSAHASIAATWGDDTSSDSYAAILAAFKVLAAAPPAFQPDTDAWQLSGQAQFQQNVTVFN